ncbi:type III-B CRISPR module-associated protein Cmr3 [Methylacidiphilum caldifontis]|uniref:type III-B CRISPR module-associated protein Cmr3 n=1 Tax=Methylacidiphilum caldifontis TaxID=2795386 RepID=UPI001A8E583D|nr:type III-B CRISPR module-associated protein Cmr3 [Methylacidiphilum caldifontis]QSR89208.1 type III-B CRISPR module-associated protein Cmr3 [Methylacidiphilum caldifontis]
MITLDLIPFDTLFFRDSRPLAAGSSFGHGANWPLPCTIHGALRTALLSFAGELPSEPKNGCQRKGKVMGEIGTDAFNWLNIKGPFPVDLRNEEVYFPRPLDLSLDSDLKTLKSCRPLKISNNTYKSNLPSPICYPVVSSTPPTKKEAPRWIPSSLFERYLKEESFIYDVEKVFWDSEYRIGIAIDPESQTVVESQFFAAEHLRLREDFALRVLTNSPPDHKKQNTTEQSLTPENLDQLTITVGGENRFCKVKKASKQLDFSNKDHIQSTRLKWVLLTPAIFRQGFLPGWINANSTAQWNVCLRLVEKESRREFRRRRKIDPNWKYVPENDPAEQIIARLVAAFIGKPVAINGWEIFSGSGGGPKPTLLAVPAGSVFYFETESENETKKLAEALHFRCRSDFYGEKGLGLGLCGTWSYSELLL